MRLNILLFAAFILFTINLNSQDKFSNITDNRGYVVKVGDYAPDFEIELLTGEKFMLSTLRGKVVMLQFTASWCSVCRAEMPFIERDIWSKHKENNNFALYGIDLKESAEITTGFSNKMNISYPLTLDLKGDKFSLYTEPGAGVTRNIIIDRSGKIIMLTRLYQPEEFAAMVCLIDQELIK